LEYPPADAGTSRPDVQRKPDGLELGVANVRSAGHDHGNEAALDNGSEGLSVKGTLTMSAPSSAAIRAE
jgi:hypothetical protein